MITSKSTGKVIYGNTDGFNVFIGKQLIQSLNVYKLYSRIDYCL